MECDVLFQMLHLKDSEATFEAIWFSHMQKDHSYIIVHATSQAIGTK